MDYEDHIHKLQANGAPSPSSSLLAAPLRQHFVRISVSSGKLSHTLTQPNTLINLSYFNIPKCAQGVVTVY